MVFSLDRYLLNKRIFQIFIRSWMQVCFCVLMFSLTNYMYVFGFGPRSQRYLHSGNRFSVEIIEHALSWRFQINSLMRNMNKYMLLWIIYPIYCEEVFINLVGENTVMVYEVFLSVRRKSPFSFSSFQSCQTPLKFFHSRRTIRGHE